MKKQKAIQKKKLVNHQLQANQAQTILAGGGGGSGLSNASNQGRAFSIVIY